MNESIDEDRVNAYLARRIAEINDEARRSGRFKSFRQLSEEQGTKPINVAEMKAILAEIAAIKDEDDPHFLDEPTGAGNELR